MDELQKTDRSKIAFAVVITTVLCIRILLALGFSFRAGGFASVLGGHDGAEYLNYAECLSRWDWSEVSQAARRHNPGWPMLVGLFAALLPGSVPIWLSAWILMLLCTVGTVWIFRKLLVRDLALSSTNVVNFSLALCLGYPTLVYYQTFALVDSALLFFTLGCACLWLSNRIVPASLMLACATLVRSPVWMLGPALLIADVFFDRNRPVKDWVMRAAAIAGAILPLAVTIYGCRTVWGGSYIDLHKPIFSFPGSGLFGADNVPTIRAIYVFATLLLFAVATALLVIKAYQSRGKDRLAVAGGIFCAGFLLFHLCMKSLVYYGTAIPLFNYQDRYMAVLWPFALVAFAPFIKRPVVAVAIVISLVLTFYWGLNYFDTIARSGTELIR